MECQSDKRFPEKLQLLFRVIHFLVNRMTIRLAFESKSAS
jgi:hypothetical protein